MKLYEGTAPCPGCGRTGEEVARRSKDSLCHDCMNALEIGKAIVKERNLVRNYYLMDDLRIGLMTWYTIPIREIENALTDLLSTFSQFDSKHVATKDGFNGSILVGKLEAATARDRFILPNITFEAAKRLCESLREACLQLKNDRDNYKDELDKKLNEERNRIYNDGVAHGRNLLMQLNRGEISVNDFEKPVKKF